MSGLKNMADPTGSAAVAAAGKRGGAPLTKEEKKKRRAMGVTAAVAYGMGGTEKAKKTRLFLHEMKGANLRPYTRDGYVDFLYSPSGSTNREEYVGLFVETPPLRALYSNDTCFPGYSFNPADPSHDCTCTLIDGPLPPGVKNAAAAEEAQRNMFAFFADMKKAHVQYLIDHHADCADALASADSELESWVEQQESGEEPKTITDKERAIKYREILNRIVVYPIGTEYEQGQGNERGPRHSTLRIKSGMVWDNNDDAPIQPEIEEEARKKPANPHALVALRYYSEGKRIKRPRHIIARSKEQPNNILTPCIERGDICAFPLKLTIYNHGKMGMNAYWLDNSVTLVKAHHVREQVLIDENNWLDDDFENVAVADFAALSDAEKAAYAALERAADTGTHALAHARALDTLAHAGHDRDAAEALVDRFAAAAFLTSDGTAITTLVRLPPDYVGGSGAPTAGGGGSGAPTAVGVSGDGEASSDGSDGAAAADTTTVGAEYR